MFYSNYFSKTPANMHQRLKTSTSSIMSEQEPLLVGIDFGSKNIRAVIYINKKFEIVRNSKNWRSTPSILVLKTKNDLLRSYENREFWNDGTHNTYSFEEHRRILFLEQETHFDRKILYNYSHKVQQNVDEWCYQIESPDEIWEKPPLLICTKFLQRLKTDISVLLGAGREFKVVLSIPELCNFQQKAAIKLAAKEAQLNCATVITTPNAIALSYCYHNRACRRFRLNDYFLVFDLGATTLNLALYHVSDSSHLHKMGIGGDLNLGGFDFDTALLRYVIKMLEAKPFDRWYLNRFTRQRLRIECERVKIELSTYSAAKFSVDIPRYGRFETEITNDMFEEMTADLCRSTIQQVDWLISNCRLTKHKIDHILVCGGSSSVRQIQRLLYDYFSQCKTRFSTLVHRDESVVQGAAMYAAMCSTNDWQLISRMNIFEAVGIGQPW